VFGSPRDYHAEKSLTFQPFGRWRPFLFYGFFYGGFYVVMGPFATSPEDAVSMHHRESELLRSFRGGVAAIDPGTPGALISPES
jgi:hypothetical protein